MEDLSKEEMVVLVDEDNQVLGYLGKLEAHKTGLLHRAISVIIFNSKGEMLIQQRGLKKYHWAGIWSNTCCSHPRKDESFQHAAERRLF
jgi:isopentenyl-diphosphate delta-isomerase